MLRCRQLLRHRWPYAVRFGSGGNRQPGSGLLGDRAFLRGDYHHVAVCVSCVSGTRHEPRQEGRLPAKPLSSNICRSQKARLQSQCTRLCNASDPESVEVLLNSCSWPASCFLSRTTMISSLALLLEAAFGLELTNTDLTGHGFRLGLMSHIMGNAPASHLHLACHTVSDGRTL